MCQRELRLENGQSVKMATGLERCRPIQRTSKSAIFVHDAF